MPKIISKHCELVKLCHINRSGPVFFRHSVVSGLPDDEMDVILRSLVLSQYQRVTDRQTDTPPMSLSRSIIAECDRKVYDFVRKM